MIIDTVAEFTYGVSTKQDMEQYLNAVMAKMNPGGIASIVEGSSRRNRQRRSLLEETLKELSQNKNYVFKLDQALQIERLQ